MSELTGTGASAQQQESEPSFYEEIGGWPVVARIVDTFYARVAEDDVLRPMYPADELADGTAARKLTMFLAQYWGGPTTYSEERGHPRLRMRHAPFRVDTDAKDRWLRHFRAGLDAAGLTPEQDARFWGYVTYAAEFMRNSPD